MEFLKYVMSRDQVSRVCYGNWSVYFNIWQNNCLNYFPIPVANYLVLAYFLFGKYFSSLEWDQQVTLFQAPNPAILGVFRYGENLRQTKTSRIFNNYFYVNTSYYLAWHQPFISSIIVIVKSSACNGYYKVDNPKQRSVSRNSLAFINIAELIQFTFFRVLT